MPKKNILITGANGQIGTVLSKELRKRATVLTTDISAPAHANGSFQYLDILDQAKLAELVDAFQIDEIYHLAAILSAKGEKDPRRTWDLNMNGLFNVLEVARQKKIQKVFFPSSIAVFGPRTPKDQTPQHTILCPATVYGISKVAGEQWCSYYHRRFGLDIRSLRFPGIIGYQTLAGGGTTDYAVDIFHYALRGERYPCFLREDSYLPMIYMPDAIRAIVELMEAPAEQIRVRDSYNLGGMSFSPGELAAAIRQQLPDFEISYEPDFRQEIADSWSNSIDDQAARRDWGWQAAYDLAEMTVDMLKNLRLHKINNGDLVADDQ